MAVTVMTEPDFKLGKPEILFRGSFVSANIMNIWRDADAWDIHPDGRRFLMLEPLESAGQGDRTASPSKINVLNWFEEMKEKAQAD